MRIRSDFYSIREGADTVYLIKGSGKALLIGTGSGAPGLAAFVAKLAGSTPVEVIVTSDDKGQTGGLGEFKSSKIYLPKGASISRTGLTNVAEVGRGDAISLGADSGRELSGFQVEPLRGHSAAGLTLLDTSDRVLLSGDALGMQAADGGLILNGKLEDFSAELAAWRERTDGKYDAVLTSRNYQWQVGPAFVDQLQNAARRGVAEGSAAFADSAAMPGYKVIKSGSAQDAASIVMAATRGAQWTHSFDFRCLPRCWPAVAPAASWITTRLEDPKAVYLSAAEFGARGDGQADDSAALQAAIDKAENRVRAGILFVPSGRYRITRTVYVWPGVRIFGYGATRPVFVLAPNTPGFQKGIGVMVMFTGARPGGAPGGRPRLPHSVSPGGQRPAERCDRGRESRHLLLGDEQHRFRDRRRQSGGGRHPLPRRAARLPEPHGLPHGLRTGGAHRGRQLRRRTSSSLAGATASSRTSRRRPGSSRWSIRSSTGSARPRSASTRPG